MILKEFIEDLIASRNKSGRQGTAHVYQCMLNSFLRFCERVDVKFYDITSDLLTEYESWLRTQELSWNTVSTYLRSLRAVYNYAMEEGKAPYVPKLFKSVYTGVSVQHRRAVKAETIAKVLSFKNRTESVQLDFAKDLFTLLFLLRGIPFVDLAHLRRTDLKDGMITYRRQKTGSWVCVSVEPEAMKILQKYADIRTSSSYLLPILDEGVADDSMAAYRSYQSQLRKFNLSLSSLATEVGIQEKITSYTARHSWATIAFHLKVPVGLISNAMGHSSIMVTETYLKPFDEEEIQKVNRMIISYVHSA